MIIKDFLKQNKIKITYTTKIILIIIVLIYISLFYTEKINLITLDLGRHIQNGAYFIEHLKPINTNFYSYTTPAHPTINHHWGSGVLFHLIHKAFGFEGISIIYILISIITVLFTFLTAQLLSNTRIAITTLLFITPLITYRTDFRPETFSFLFMSLFLFILFRQDIKHRKTKLLAALPIIQICWINCHIFFLIGPGIIGTFIIKNILRKVPKAQNKRLFKYLCLCILVSLINPHHIVGLLAPLTIFNEYPYKVAENQSLIFMFSRFKNPIYIHFTALSLLSISSTLLTFYKKEKDILFDTCLLGTFIALSFCIVRLIPVAGYLMLVIISKNIYIILKEHKHIRARLQNSLLLLFLIFISYTCLKPKYEKSGFYYPIQPFFGIGLQENTNNPANFIKTNNLKGPIFNNYDIGGYLIYHLNNKEKVFIDNRPEAYPIYFFKNIYEPMQENQTVWRNQSENYNFNLIIFYRHDMTTWAQSFLIKRIEDPEWIPIYVDLYTLILIKNKKQNNRIIEKHRLPKELFILKQNKA